MATESDSAGPSRKPQICKASVAGKRGGSAGGVAWKAHSGRTPGQGALPGPWLKARAPPVRMGHSPDSQCVTSRQDLTSLKFVAHLSVAFPGQQGGKGRRGRRQGGMVSQAEAARRGAGAGTPGRHSRRHSPQRRGLGGSGKKKPVVRWLQGWWAGMGSWMWGPKPISEDRPASSWVRLPGSVVRGHLLTQQAQVGSWLEIPSESSPPGSAWEIHGPEAWNTIHRLTKVGAGLAS